MLDEILSRIAHALPPERWIRSPLIVAVSGGADSMALLRIVSELRRRYEIDPAKSSAIVAHVNYGLRGEASDLDEAFVAELAKELDFKFALHRPSIETNSSEDELRKIRYGFLLDLAYQTGSRLIATAHNADDQIETILFRLFRGTGLAGLSGIPPVANLDDTVSVVRPLLGVRRQEIETLLAALKQTFRVDVSNLSNDYTRNFLRNELIPKIESRFIGQFPTGLIRLSQQANELEAFVNSQARELFDVAVQRFANEVEIDLRALAGQAPPVLRQVFRIIWQEQNWPEQSMSFEKWQQLAELVSRRVMVATEMPGRIRVEVRKNILILQGTSNIGSNGSRIRSD